MKETVGEAIGELADGAERKPDRAWKILAGGFCLLLVALHVYGIRSRDRQSDRIVAMERSITKLEHRLDLLEVKLPSKLRAQIEYPWINDGPRIRKRLRALEQKVGLPVGD